MLLGLESRIEQKARDLFLCPTEIDNFNALGPSILCGASLRHSWDFERKRWRVWVNPRTYESLYTWKRLISVGKRRKIPRSCVSIHLWLIYKVDSQKLSLKSASSNKRDWETFDTSDLWRGNWKARRGSISVDIKISFWRNAKSRAPWTLQPPAEVAMLEVRRHLPCIRDRSLLYFWPFDDPLWCFFPTTQNPPRGT